ncbi:MAG: AraC family transcriptional regulator [Clostridia bacterium]|jgi:AraC-like DNA-binding protein|nr:AraC family transcriptional regulator [Clostridia bacterium]MCI2000336.1 AraC family transcriptional regulator [Clostridia bacterium]MCI2015516.1 AraC family transcriptional regulator [Clostridia bacterium]
MKKEIRTVCYDEELQIETYRFEGIEQPFPNHFHEHYVIGFIEEGKRCLSCKNKEYTIKKGDIIVFNPGDNHACVQSSNEKLDYRGFNISKSTMLNLTDEITGKKALPGFIENVIQDDELACCLSSLHKMVMSGLAEFEKEEKFILMISLLISKYGRPFESCIAECGNEIDRACKFIEKHYSEHICMDQICTCAGLSKSTLLRAFTKSKGITPYRYLQTIRINEAKKLLEQGVAPIEAAIRTGFSDQSHFTNFFSTFIGLSPGVYREIFFDSNLKESEGDRNEK